MSSQNLYYLLCSREPEDRDHALRWLRFVVDELDEEYALCFAPWMEVLDAYERSSNPARMQAVLRAYLAPFDGVIICGKQTPETEAFLFYACGASKEIVDLRALGDGDPPDSMYDLPEDVAPIGEDGEETADLLDFGRAQWEAP